MPHHIHPRNGQNTTVLRRNTLRVGFSKIVDPARESIQVCAESRILRVVPHLRPFGHTVHLHPPIKTQIFVAPVLSRTPARFTIKEQQQIGLVAHLRPTVGIKHRFPVGGINVRNAEGIPEDFGFLSGEGWNGE